jgi:hypothetical protein
MGVGTLGFSLELGKTPQVGFFPQMNNLLFQKIGDLAALSDLLFLK